MATWKRKWRWLAAALLALALVVRILLVHDLIPGSLRPQVTRALHEVGVAIPLPVRPVSPGPLRGAGPGATRYAPRQLIVQLVAEADDKTAERIAGRLGAELLRRYPESPGLVLLRLPDGMSVPVATKLAASFREVDFAEPNILYYMDVLPNDAGFPELWGMHSPGSSDPADVDVDAAEVWDWFKGSDRAVIGVIDSGVDYRHVDLQANMWVNPGEVPDDAIDNDGNGYVDDVHGIDAENGTGDPMDVEGHGTHVAGTIGAVGNNRIGVAGVSWSTRIAACRFLSADGFGTTADAIRCLDYFGALKARGIDIVVTNNSWGRELYSQALSDAIRRNGERGIVFVAAAGNSGGDSDAYPHYPAALKLQNVVSVGAIDQLGERAYFSNYGRVSVDLFAPGVDILSLAPNDELAVHSGTSMAAPHVAGMIGLYAAEDRQLRGLPLIHHLLDTATVRPGLSGLSVTGGIAHMVLRPRDGDDDGMDDRWELRHGLDPLDWDDAGQDTDGDGLINLREYRLGTAPKASDTDADGLSDGQEVEQTHTSPLQADTDRDGLRDAREVNSGTNPLVSDSDGDGIADGAELTVHHTSALKADTDGDGISDGFEISRGLAPGDPTDATLDPDTDGLNNRAEATAGTDPHAADTDGDDLGDAEEVNRHQTNPLQYDTDGDRIADGWEVRYLLDPLDPRDGDLDADGDGAANRDEFWNGTDPMSAASVPARRPWSGLRGNARQDGFIGISTRDKDIGQRWHRRIARVSSEQEMTIGNGVILMVRDSRQGREMATIDLADGRERWTYAVPQTFRMAQPVLRDQLIVTVVHSKSSVYTLTGLGMDGAVKYQRVLEGISGDTDNLGLVMDGDRVVVAAGDQLLGMDAASGDPVWRATIPGFPGWTPAMDAAHVAAFNQGTLTVLDRQTGKQVASIVDKRCPAGDYPLTMFDSAGALYVHNGSCLSRFDIATRKVTWTRTDVPEGYEPMLTRDETVAVRWGGLQGLDPASGATLWSWTPGRSVGGNPVATDTHVFFQSEGSTVAFARAGREVVWEEPGVNGLRRALAGSDEGVLVILESGGDVSVINLEGDRDGDTMPDWWERHHGLALTDAADALQDADGDGFSNRDESAQRTDPRSADSDNDGLTDGAERAAGSNPLSADTDADGLSDADEVNKYRSSPLLRDSDGDQISDADEVNRYHTNPADLSSKPDLLFTATISFESGLPAGWTNPNPSRGAWEPRTGTASHGSRSLAASGGPDRTDVEVEWKAPFAATELVFDAKMRDENSWIDIEFVVGSRPQSRRVVYQPEWQTYRAMVPEGTTTIRFSAQYLGRLALPTDIAWVDNVVLQKPQPFGIDANNVLVRINDELHEYTQEGVAVRGAVLLPRDLGAMVVTPRHELALVSSDGWTFFDLQNETIRTVPADIRSYSGRPVATRDALLLTGDDERIARYDLDGRFEGLFGERGTAESIAYGADGFVYTIDYPGVVRRYDAATLRLHATIPLERGPRGNLAVDAEGVITILNAEGRTRFDPSGKRIGLRQGDARGLSGPLVVTRSGRLLNGSDYPDPRFHVAAWDLRLFSEHRLGNSVDDWSPDLTIALPRQDGQDSDADGCPDWWELTHRLLPFDASDGPRDLDADGLRNAGECQANADPRRADTDLDGLKDGDEVKAGSDPSLRDSDWDGLPDLKERELGSSPRLVDSDADGLSDRQEVEVEKSNPVDTDSDDDGAADAWEVAGRFDPNIATDGAIDPDGDGVLNRDESALGTDGRDADTDDDGLGDGQEVALTTNPRERDTDGDLLDDGAEVAHRFNPRKPGESFLDSDGDGFGNLLEVRHRSDPREPAARPRPAPWSDSRGGPEHRAFVPVRFDGSGFRQVWVSRLTPSHPAGAPDLMELTVGNSMVFGANDFSNNPRLVVAADTGTGNILWSADVGDLVVLSQPVIAGADVIAGVRHIETGLVIRLNGQTGQEVYRKVHDVPPYHLPEPVVSGERAVFASGFGGPMAIGVQDGARKWLETFLGTSSLRPAVTNDQVISYTRNRTTGARAVRAYDLGNGDERVAVVDPERDVEESVVENALPVVGYGGDVYVATVHALSAFDLHKQRVKWAIDGSFDAYPPSIGAGFLYAVESGDLVSLDERDGREVWRWTGGNGGDIRFPPVATATHVFVSSQRRLYAIDVQTGKQVWTIAFPGWISIGDDGVVYVAGTDGTATAITMAPEPTPEGPESELAPDSDRDGMPTAWEEAYSFDPNDGADGAEDADRDGLPNVQEYRLGIDPRSVDSDGDGVRDADEVREGFDPQDATCRSPECRELRKGLDMRDLIILKQARDKALN
jgi:subtilisin family serine protease/outer membrane protein assembly factor BamB